MVEGRAGEQWLIYQPSGGPQASAASAASAAPEYTPPAVVLPPAAAGCSSGRADAGIAASAGVSGAEAAGGNSQAAGESPAGPSLRPHYDACSSWWTQTMRGDLQVEVTRAVAHAAGRYMHVMFPGTPAVRCRRYRVGYTAVA